MARTIVITGATSGVGLDIAKSFSKKGWRVIAIARNKEKLAKLAEMLDDNFFFYSVDITKYEEVSLAFEEIKKINGPIDILVNNAATFKMRNFLECTANDIHQMIDTNLKGAMFCTLEALKNMRVKSGRIINIASVAATRGIENQAIYCASKFGIDGFAEALNQETIKNGTSISTIYPGGIDTPLWNQDKNPYPGDVSALLKPADITRAIEYIADLPNTVILKKLVIFPSNEWH